MVVYIKRERAIPGNQGVRAQSFHCLGPKFNPWSETKTQKQSTKARKTKQKKKKKEEIRTHKKTSSMLGHVETEAHENAAVCTSRKETCTGTTLSTP